MTSRLDSVIVTTFQRHADQRGVFAEIFRESWSTGISPVQWNLVHSEPRVLRGVHIHVSHADYLMCVAGEMMLVMKDARPESPTCGQTEVLTLRADAPAAVTIPPGVAHGFYYAKPATHIYSVSEYWNVHDELGCRWDDPALGVDWGVTDPTVSPRDRDAGSYDEMVAEFLEKRAALA